MEEVFATAQREMEDLAARTMVRLREAAEKEVSAAKAELTRREEELAQREGRLRAKEAREAKDEGQGPEGAPPASTPTPTRAPAPSLRQAETPTEGYLAPPGPVEGSRRRSSSATSSPRLSTASAGTASQLCAMFEKKFATKARPTLLAGRSDGSIKERTSDAGRLSFRAQEGPFRRPSSAGAAPSSTLAEHQDKMSIQSHQDSATTPSQEAEEQYEIAVYQISSLNQAPPPMPDVASPKRPPRAASPTCASHSPSQEGTRRQEKEEMKAKRPTLHPTPKRSLADLLKADEERSTMT